MAEGPSIELFIKASDDAESVGNCPFSQRLFMILWLKQAKFKVTTVDMKRAPDVLKDLAPGSQPPFLLYNGEVKTDINKIEEFLEQTLAPPQYPKLCCRFKRSICVGDDIFRNFSAYVKNPTKFLEKKFLKTLVDLNAYLETPLQDELDQNPNCCTSRRRFLDGETLSLADCNLLPKLHIVKVICEYYREFTITTGLTGLTRYLENAYKVDEFHYTCPRSQEIIDAYHGVAKHVRKQTK
ncbi:unnamed protein product [Ophioblennius macclurei]